MAQEVLSGKDKLELAVEDGMGKKYPKIAFVFLS
jgi:hypothetical protein